jgi:hypothetical protein
MNENVNTPLRYPIMAMVMLTLLAAMWAGIVRLGWGWPPLLRTLPMSHGPLMVCGFLGTLIGLERAVALSALPQVRVNYRWFYVGPFMTVLGAILLIIVPGMAGPLLITFGSLSLVLVFGLILRIELAVYTALMAGGALFWLIGNGLWLCGWPVYSVGWWWAGFLILTIAGERLELNRVLRLSGGVQALFLVVVGLFMAGVVVGSIPGQFGLGTRIAGAGLIVLALWLLRYDIARYTVRKTGLTRFIAVCLLAGYAWLAIGGGLGLFYGGVTAGPYYDAMLHAIFVGFVFSMIFGHAPIVFPAVLGRSIAYHPAFYTHLILLHLSLILRVGGDLTLWLPGRYWGGLLNAVAVLLFLMITAWSVLRRK